MTSGSAIASTEDSIHSLADPGTHRFDPASILPTTEPNLAGNYPQASLEAVTEIFGGTAPAVYIEPQIASIPKTLRHVLGAPNGKWQPPWQIIGIKCDSASNGLCAIIFEKEAAFRLFVTKNPVLKSTLLTWWPESNCIIWVHSTDWVPPNVTMGAVSWISEGVIPFAAPGLGPGHFVWQNRPIVSVPFAELKWPEEMEAAFQIPLLQHLYGPRYRRVGPRKVDLNPAFWAHFLTAKMGLAYYPHRKTFSIQTPGMQTPSRVEFEELIRLTTHGLQQAANLDPNHFPSREMRLPRIKRIIEQMKVVAAVHTTGEKEGVVQFLTEAVVARQGDDLTVAEIHGRYSANRRTKMLPLFAASVFQRLLPGLVTDLFGAIKSHDLRRRGPDGFMHWHRGFHGLGFKVA